MQKQLQRFSGVRGRDYTTALQNVGKLLSLSQVTLGDLAVRLGCVEAQEAAEEVLARLVCKLPVERVGLKRKSSDFPLSAGQTPHPRGKSLVKCLYSFCFEQSAVLAKCKHTLSACKTIFGCVCGGVYCITWLPHLCLTSHLFSLSIETCQHGEKFLNESCIGI